MKFRQNLFLLLFLILFTGLFSGFFKVPPQEKAPQEALLTSAPVEKNPGVKKILNVDHSLLERAKIEYLLGRMRQSPYTFIRNGQPYGGQRAAMHMAWKYKKRLDRIKTVEDFVENIASRSWETGEDYLIKFKNGKLYRLREVFDNELRELNDFLQTAGKTPAP